MQFINVATTGWATDRADPPCREGALRCFISKDELDAYHLSAPPNDFANAILAAFGKSQFETIRDNRGNDDLRAMS